MEFREEEEEDQSKLGDGYMEELIFAFAVAIAVALFIPSYYYYHCNPCILLLPVSHSIYQLHMLREFSAVPHFLQLDLVEERRSHHREPEGKPLRDSP